MKKVFDINAFANSTNIESHELGMMVVSIVELGNMFGIEEMQGMTREEAVKFVEAEGAIDFPFEDEFFVDEDKYVELKNLYEIFEVVDKQLAKRMVTEMHDLNDEEALENVAQIGYMAQVITENDPQFHECIKTGVFTVDQRGRYFSAVGMMHLLEALNELKKGGE